MCPGHTRQPPPISLHQRAASAGNNGEMIVELNAETRLRRSSAAQALTSHGFPTAAKTLATLASRGGGPTFQSFGRIPLYRWSDLLAWAESRLSAPRRSTSETA